MVRLRRAEDAWLGLGLGLGYICMVRLGHAEDAGELEALEHDRGQRDHPRDLVKVRGWVGRQAARPQPRDLAVSGYAVVVRASKKESKGHCRASRWVG